MEAAGSNNTVSRRRFLALSAGTTAALAVRAPVAGASSRGPAPLDLGDFIRFKMHAARVPGLSACVVRRRHIVWARSFGWANIHRHAPCTPDTIFMLASVSKTLVATAVMQAVEEGLIDLDADVNEILPFRVRNPGHPYTVITPRMLLTHASSLRDNWHVLSSSYVRGDSSVGLGEFLSDYLAPTGRFFDPGRSYYPFAPGNAIRYCNIAVALAAFLVEAASGTAFDRWCDGRIFAPLEMSDTGWHLADVDRSAVAMPYRYIAYRDRFRPYGQYGSPDYPDGELRATSMDLARHLMAFMAGGRFGGVKILQPGSVHEMQRIQFPDLGRRQGIIWYTQRRGDALYWGHTGGDSGVSTRMFFRPRDDVGVIVLTNGTPVKGGWTALRDVEIRLFREVNRL